MKLNSENGKEIEYVAESLITGKGAANKTVLNQMESGTVQDIRVVSEFSDVFLEELPGMPPDHGIEFVIELVPGTAPIYETLYNGC